MKVFLKKYWFILGLIGVALITVADTQMLIVAPGLWLKNHRGPDFVIVLIFLLSGLALDIRQVRDGLADFRGTLLALIIIFIVAPLVALPYTLMPMESGVILGLLLVAVMPTTLSSGVVMTGSAGGNMAHALLITIIANILAVVTIPVSLALLLNFSGNSQVVEIDQLPIMIKIGCFVLLPLVTGILLRKMFSSQVRKFLQYTTICNQVGILMMVWMALCAGREAVVAELDSLMIIMVTVFTFHCIIVLAALGLTKYGQIPKRRRESVILMGGQKTLPLSAILQVTLFPTFGTALVVCVVHHIVHLIMDAYLVRYLKEKKG